MTDKKELIMSLGSNCDQETCMSEAMSRLRDMFGNDIVFTEQIWTTPIGIESESFLNCLAFTHTSHKLEHVVKAVKHIEKMCGSRKGARANNIVKMDIDILKYGGQVLHESDWSREYIVRLMKCCPFTQ